jgi:hypothetical protein
VHASDGPDEELTVRPGSQAGWTLPLMGVERCQGLGHELDSMFSYLNGLLVGYCIRCEARVEVPWFRGGTAAVLGAVMARQALNLQRPAASVLEDLEQVEGLLSEDLAQVAQVLALVRNARTRAIRRQAMQ